MSEEQEIVESIESTCPFYLRPQTIYIRDQLKKGNVTYTAKKNHDKFACVDLGSTFTILFEEHYSKDQLTRSCSQNPFFHDVIFSNPHMCPTPIKLKFYQIPCSVDCWPWKRDYIYTPEYLSAYKKSRVTDNDMTLFACFLDHPTFSLLSGIRHIPHNLCALLGTNAFDRIRMNGTSRECVITCYNSFGENPTPFSLNGYYKLVPGVPVKELYNFIPTVKGGKSMCIPGKELFVQKRLRHTCDPEMGPLLTSKVRFSMDGMNYSNDNFLFDSGNLGNISIFKKEDELSSSSSNKKKNNNNKKDEGNFEILYEYCNPVHNNRRSYNNNNKMKKNNAMFLDENKSSEKKSQPRKSLLFRTEFAFKDPSHPGFLESDPAQRIHGLFGINFICKHFDSVFVDLITQEIFVRPRN
jgi:hypothetical protein